MRFLWVLENDEPDIARARKFGINGFYLDPRDPRTTKEKLLSLRNQGFAVGIYGAWNWAEASGGPVAFADWMHQRVKFLTDGRLDQPRVQFDIEAHDADYVLTCLKHFRSLPGERYRSLSWTLEGMQGGWFTPELVDFLKAKAVRVVPQAYSGAMQDWAADRVFVDVLARGIPYQSISLFYDAADLLPYADGFIFEQGRLPS